METSFSRWNTRNRKEVERENDLSTLYGQFIGSMLFRLITLCFPTWSISDS